MEYLIENEVLVIREEKSICACCSVEREREREREREIVRGRACEKELNLCERICECDKVMLHNKDHTNGDKIQSTSP